MSESIDTPKQTGRLITIEAEAMRLRGILNIPEQAHGLVILAHGIESSSENSHRISSAHAQFFNQNKLATLIVDLFTSDERKLDEQTGFFHLNTDIMQQRLIGMVDWLQETVETQNFAIGYLGTGAVGAAALIAAAERPDNVHAIVAASPRLDLAKGDLPRITAPTLLIAAGNDPTAVKANQEALDTLKGDKRFAQVPGVASLCESQQSLREVTRLAGEWFMQWLVRIV